MNLLRLPSAPRRQVYRPITVCAKIQRFLNTPTSREVPEDGLPTSQPPQNLLTLSPETLNSYNVSNPPSSTELKHADAFFTRIPPTLLFSAPYFRAFPPSPFPEVAFLGRSNVGKSSLLNALFGRPNEKTAHVSRISGRTRTMNGYVVGGEGIIGAKARTYKNVDAANASDPTWKRVGRGGLVLVDMPGYGIASPGSWGVETMKYLMERKQLRRTYVVVNLVHGLKKSDLQLLVELRREGIPHQIVLNKVDKLLRPGPKSPPPQKLHKCLRALRDTHAVLKHKLNKAAAAVGGESTMLDLLCCSAEKAIDEEGRNRKIGIDELRWSVLTACGLENEPLPRSKTQKGRNWR